MPECLSQNAMNAFMRAAYHQALHSGDQSTQNGAIIIDESWPQVVSIGWNDLHVFEEHPERRIRPGKYLWTEHAERMAIYDAARNGRKTEGMTMFAAWASCADCARGIVHAGIKRLVRHQIPQHLLRPDWYESCKVGDQMFAEAGVEVITLEEVLGVEFLFNGIKIKV
jgi:dCMP deaminase